jgi:hypothetical protein
LVTLLIAPHVNGVKPSADPRPVCPILRSHFARSRNALRAAPVMALAIAKLAVS